MIGLIRLLRVLVILAIAALAVSLLVGVVSPHTGGVEKVVLMLLLGGCVFLAAKVTDLAAWLSERVESS